MELVILYNTESFNYNDASKDPVKRESVISYIDFNPNKKYTMKSVITMANIDENRGLYETSTQDFFTMELGTLTENSNTAQKSYIAGSLGLSPDRIHIVRIHYSAWDVVAFAGGLALAGYVAIYVVIFLW